MRHYTTLALLVLVLTAFGCTEEVPTYPVTTDTVTSPDAGTDTYTEEVRVDSDTGIVPDTDSGTDQETGLDTGEDAGSDTDTGEQDIGTDSGTDTDTDTGMDAEDTSTDTGDDGGDTGDEVETDTPEIDCDPGYEVVNGACANIDECNDPNVCGPNATCADTEGDYDCTCDAGYADVAGTCEDVNECDDPNVCGNGTECNNTLGGYECLNVDECVDGTDSCSAGTECIDGDPLNGEQAFTCANVDECSNGSANCQTGTTCQDLDPNTDNDTYACVDNNECANGTAVCDSNATCTNTYGSFSCACDSGFTGDGFSCRELNVCGDGIVDSAEVCDEGASTGDVCVPGYGQTCTWCDSCTQVVTETGATCGNGNLDVNEGEECDGGPGCTASCAVATGYTCIGGAPCLNPCEQYVGDFTANTNSDLITLSGYCSVDGNVTITGTATQLFEVHTLREILGTFRLDLNNSTGNKARFEYVNNEVAFADLETVTSNFEMDNFVVTDLVTNQGDAVDFVGFPSLTTIGGDMFIRDGAKEANTTNPLTMDAFNALLTVGGDLQIIFTDFYTVSGFQSVTSVGGVMYIQQNPDLVSLGGAFSSSLTVQGANAASQYIIDIQGNHPDLVDYQNGQYQGDGCGVCDKAQENSYQHCPSHDTNAPVTCRVKS